MSPLVTRALREFRGLLAEDGRGLAFDRASARTFDTNGNLHVARSHISKATVNDYYGQEINAAMQGKPGWTDLVEDQKYAILRDPDELRKATKTFNRLPILRKHVPITAARFRPEEVIGTTGDNATFDGEYLDNSLTFWAGIAIRDIEDEVKKQLSSAYSYDVTMSPGTYAGTRYDGAMRNIRGNHVALVREGRAGPEVAVGDAMPRQFTRGDAMDRLTSPARPRRAGARDEPPEFTGRPHTGGYMSPSNEFDPLDGGYATSRDRRRARDDEPDRTLSAEEMVQIIGDLVASMEPEERERLCAVLDEGGIRGIMGDSRQRVRMASDRARVRMSSGAHDAMPRGRHTRAGSRSFADTFPAAATIKVS
jgi:hypothetical protein